MNEFIRRQCWDAPQAALVLIAMSLLVPVWVAMLGSEWQTGPNWVGVAATVAIQIAASLGLLWVRRAPVAVATGLTGTATGLLLVQLAWPGALLPEGDSIDPYRSIDPWIAFATSAAAVVLALTGDRRRGWLTWAPFGLLTVVATQPWQGSIGVAASGLLMSAVPALLGLYLAARRRLLDALTERAVRAEREQQLLADQARADERARLAAEVHDLVTHRVSLMVLQASALRITAADEQTRTAAEDLRVTGCQALAELRDLVGVLRAVPSDDPPPDAAPVDAPLELSTLVAESRSVGAQVELVEHGDQSLTSPVVTRTAHRIVQEALTNARKHAPGALVRVEVGYGASQLRLRITNAAPPPADPATPAGPGDSGDVGLAAVGSGTGLLGLRQRVDLVHGTLSTTVTPTGGFEVDARLPVFVPTGSAEPQR